MNDQVARETASSELSKDPLFGAAILKLSFIRKDMLNTPGFTFVYNGTLRELGITDGQVDRFIKKHRDALVAHLEKSGRP
ncbi:MAG: hypothetical protein JXX14_21535 [Deltaproteobacteria bacterium]|nr:hypothetical protein [Deltaproteobacteria bacterium]